MRQRNESGSCCDRTPKGCAHFRPQWRDQLMGSCGERAEPIKPMKSSGNGNQMRQLIREGKSASKALQAQIDRAVALADQEIGIRAEGSFTQPTRAATLSPTARAATRSSSLSPIARLIPGADRQSRTPAPLTTTAVCRLLPRTPFLPPRRRNQFLWRIIPNAFARAGCR